MSVSFAQFIQQSKEKNKLVVQPRMGFGTIDEMQSGLQLVKNADARTIGTITLDSYTRVNQYDNARNVLEQGDILNGYPIVTHGAIKTRSMLDSLISNNFSVQVRHGTALPKEVFKSIIDCGIDATEGGPISYCLPYSRLPLKSAIDNWAESCQLFSKAATRVPHHIESFAGCMLGQLCPPSLLIALGILECIFFRKHGIFNVSLSYAQGTNSIQDIAALKALRDLAKEYLYDLDWHVVMYTYMGMFPMSIIGSYNVMIESARVAKLAQCERLIVKTPAEAHRIPTIEENIAALEVCYAASNEINNIQINLDEAEYKKVYHEAKILINTTLKLDSNINNAFLIAFEKGILDIPFCLHKENLNRTRCYIDKKGYLQWANYGNLPFNNTTKEDKKSVTSNMLLDMLGYVRNRYDEMNFNNRFYKE